MKTTYILFKPYRKYLINPLQLRLLRTAPSAKISREISVIKLLEVILVLSITIGLLVFLGVKIL